MKKVFLAAWLLFSGGKLLAISAEVYNGTSKPLDVEVKWAAETKIACRPSKFSLEPGKHKTRKKPCNPKYLKYKEKGTTEWIEAQKHPGTEPKVKFVILEARDAGMMSRSTGGTETVMELFNNSVVNYINHIKNLSGEPESESYTREEMEEYFLLPPLKQ